MDHELYAGRIEGLRARNRQLVLVTAGAVLAAVLEAAALLRMVGSERQHFVPPEIARPFWIAGASASPEYFEDMAIFLHGLSMNVTPETAKAACRQYLAYIVPADRNNYQKRCDTTAARLKRDNASQLFAIERLRTDARARQVELDGTLTTYIGKEPFHEKQHYRMVFQHQQGRFYLASHEQTDAGQPHP